MGEEISVGGLNHNTVELAVSRAEDTASKRPPRVGICQRPHAKASVNVPPYEEGQKNC
jgi:hypothetical protein